jgi:hypothetical protein
MAATGATGALGGAAGGTGRTAATTGLNRVGGVTAAGLLGGCGGGARATEARPGSRAGVVARSATSSPTIAVGGAGRAPGELAASASMTAPQPPQNRSSARLSKLQRRQTGWRLWPQPPQ